MFKDVCIHCDLNPDAYSEEDSDRILTILKCISKEICIDKTYVEMEDSMYEKTFMFEEGWNSLCELIHTTDYGKTATKTERRVIIDAYKMMIVCYVELFFEDLGYDVSNMHFTVSPNTIFAVEYLPDTMKEWKTYPGKWQYWK